MAANSENVQAQNQHQSDLAIPKQRTEKHNRCILLRQMQ